MSCEIDGCAKPVNRDGVCFKHKLQTIRYGGLARLASEREGNYTQRELAQENIEGAEATGTPIQSTKRWV